MSPSLTIQTPITHLDHRSHRVEANEDGFGRASTVADPAV